MAGFQVSTEAADMFYIGPRHRELRHRAYEL